VLGFFQPGAACGQGFLGVALGARVALGLGLGQLLLELGDGRAQLRDGALRPGQGLGVRPAPLGFLGLADRVLDSPQPRFQVLARFPGYRPDLLPLLLDAAQRGLG